MSHQLRVLLVILALPIGALMLAGGLGVLAEHIAGATYNGTHQGGGEVEFEVSADGSGIKFFTAKDVPGNTCTFPEVTVNYDPPLAITNHAFSSMSSVGLSVSGSFPQPGQAQGILTVKQPGFPACNAFDIPWSATADGPTPSSTPSPTPTLPPTASPTPSPTPGPVVKGDVDCDGDVDAVDALRILRFVAQLSTGLPGGCDPIGQ